MQSTNKARFLLEGELGISPESDSLQFCVNTVKVS